MGYDLAGLVESGPSAQVNPMKDKIAMIVAILLTAGPALASQSEDMTNGAVTHQADGGHEGDAPDSCASARPPFRLDIDGDVEGLLVPDDDEVDVYLARVAPGDLGERLSAIAVPEASEAGLDITIDVLMPGCGTSVTAPENQPSIQVQPPQPGPGEQRVEPTGTPVCDTFWRFTIDGLTAEGGDPLHTHGNGHGPGHSHGNGLGPGHTHGNRAGHSNGRGHGHDQHGHGNETVVLFHAPATIRLVWSNGVQEDVPMSMASTPSLAVYQTSTNTGYTLYRAWAIIDDDWSGAFTATHAICGLQEGTAFTEGNTRTQYEVQWTPLVAGDYAIVFTLIQRDPGPSVPTSVPVSCHFGCKPGFDTVNHVLGYVGALAPG